MSRILRTDAGRELYAQVCGTGPVATCSKEPELTAEYVTIVLLSLILVVRRRFAAGTDPREITVFVREIAQVEPMLRRREAEALIRFTCGEWEMRMAVEWELTLDAQLILLVRFIAELRLSDVEVIGVVAESEDLFDAVERYAASVGGVSVLEQMLLKGKGRLPPVPVSDG